MNRNRRRSLPDIVPPSEEEQPASDEQNGNRETRLRSRSLSRVELDFQASSVYRTTAEEGHLMRDVGVGTDVGGSSSAQTEDDDHPGKPYYPRFPHILVEAPQPGKAKEIDPGKKENPPESITEPISELPFVEPTYSRYYPEPEPAEEPTAPLSPSESLKTSRSWKESLVASMTRLFSLVSLRKGISSSDIADTSLDEISISGKDEYDREEALITKTEKYFKKRAPLVPRYDDSEDSFMEPRESQWDHLPLIVREGQEDKESPNSTSGEERRLSNRYKTPSTSEASSPSSVRLGFGDRTMHHLGSGMVFIYMVIPPDGGYGWIIMVLSFISQLIVDGIIFSIGSILPAIERDFDVRPSVMVMVASVQIGCYFMSGAFGSILINRFAFRPVSMAGAIGSILAIVAGSYCPNLALLIVFYSAIGGITLSLMWVSSQLIVACYFERYRPIANGFSCSGVGAGAMAFSLMQSWLVPIIGWRNVLRVQAGLIVVVLLIGIAFVEVRPTQVGVLPENILDDSSSDEYYGNFYVHDFMRTSDKSFRSGSVLSTYNPNEGKFKCCKCWERCRHKQQERKEAKRREDERNLVIRPTYIERDDLFYTGPAEYEKPRSKEHLEGKEIHLVGSDKNTQQVNYGIQHINKLETEEKKSLRGSPRSTRVSIESEHAKKKKRCAESKFMIALSRLFDYRLFKLFEFRILVASAFLFPMGFNIPFVYSRARTTIPDEFANLIAPSIGFTNFAIRIACGFVAYKRRAWTTVICGGGLVFGGFFVFVSAFYGDDLVWFQMVYGLCYGVAPAVYSTLRALIYVKYLGLPKLTNAFGITALAMGSGVFIGTTIAGELVGDSHNYPAAFAFAGVCLMVSGLLKLLLPQMVKCHERRQERKRKRERHRSRERQRSRERERSHNRSRSH